MQVQAAQIHRKRVHTYKLWDGEMYATVILHVGAHGLYSAAVVVEQIDSPIQTYSFSGYRPPRELSWQEKMAASEKQTLEWVAETLTQLSRGTQLATGTECTVHGLKTA